MTRTVYVLGYDFALQRRARLVPVKDEDGR